MKTLKFTMKFAIISFIICLITAFTTEAQIHFVGFDKDGEGIAGWNADGSGLEPAAIGHLVPAEGYTNQPYYGSSHDYISGNQDDAAFHFLHLTDGFPEFGQALIEYGFNANQVKMKFGLISLEDDIEGMDWFFMEDIAYANYYNNHFTIELAGSPMFKGYFNYLMMSINTLSGNWMNESSYAPLKYIADNSDLATQEVAKALLRDLDGAEIKITYELTRASSFTGNGRDGFFCNVINGLLEVGYPQMPFTGLNVDNEGLVAWDANDYAPEPPANGHNSQPYYKASVDYDGINAAPNACLGHFIDGSTGFYNTMLQLQYLGFDIGDLRLKLGLTSLGQDIEFQDWGVENGQQWSNYYNNTLDFELSGERILKMMQDTNHFVKSSGFWESSNTIGKVYQTLDPVSFEAQQVRQSFLKDLGTHILENKVIKTTVCSSISANGRTGAIFQIHEAAIVGVHKNVKFVPEGTVSGVWSAEDSPIYVDGNLTIEYGQTLTIEPSVKVYMRGPYHYSVKGSVIAEACDREILFTRSNPLFYWDGFDYDASIYNIGNSIFKTCVFEYSSAQGVAEAKSGGVFAVKNFDSLFICNSTFKHNRALLEDNLIYTCGGAIALQNSSPLIFNCIFYDNKALDYGGAILAYSNSNPIISNCLFYENYGRKGGAIAFHTNSSGILMNNTIADNIAGAGAGLHFSIQSSPEIINTILWGNKANYGDQVYLSGTSNVPGFYFCDIEKGEEGFAGGTFSGDYKFSIEDDPEFEEVASYPYMISGSSPCINTGTPWWVQWYYDEYIPETCLCGASRILNGRIEMGVYELLTVGMDETVANANLDFQISPNPSSDYIKLEFNLREKSYVSIALFDAAGNQVTIIENDILTDGEQDISYYMGSLPIGIYLCRMQIDDEVVTKKIVKVE